MRKRLSALFLALTRTAALAACGRRLSEPRYTQAAQRAVTFLISQPPAGSGLTAFPASAYPSSPLYAQATCGASAALALAQLTLGAQDGMEEYAQSGLRLLSAALHTFVRQDGLVMHNCPRPQRCSSRRFASPTSFMPKRITQRRLTPSGRLPPPQSKRSRSAVHR